MGCNGGESMSLGMSVGGVEVREAERWVDAVVTFEIWDDLRCTDDWAGACDGSPSQLTQK